MPLRERLLFWVVSITASFLFLWFFRQTLLPFVTGITIAYLLNPLVLILERWRLSRTVAALIILATFLLAVVLLLVLITPPVYQELLQLARAAPGYIDALWEQIQPLLQMLQIEVSEDSLNQSLREILKNNIRSALNLSSNLLGELLSSGRALVDLLVFLLLTPLVSFFIMKDWHRLVGWVEDMLPRDQKDDVMELLARIDGKVAGFIRGQLMVALVLGIIYALALSIAGLQYGFLIGLVSGILSIIPLFGSVVGLVTGVIVAFFQGGSLVFIGVIAAIFLAGQFLEGNFITPRIMSDSVGLHPLWILFALMAGNALLGIVGMLLAIPVAAATGVVLDYFIGRYKSSKYY